MSLLWSLIIIPLVAIFYYFVIYSKPKNDDWESLPTLEQYLKKYPHCKTADDENTMCSSCSSDKVIFQPLTAMSDPRYRHVCLSCNKVLFRSNSIM